MRDRQIEQAVQGMADMFSYNVIKFNRLYRRVVDATEGAISVSPGWTTTRQNFFKDCLRSLYSQRPVVFTRLCQDIQIAVAAYTDSDGDKDDDDWEEDRTPVRRKKGAVKGPKTYTKIVKREPPPIPEFLGLSSIKTGVLSRWLSATREARREQNYDVVLRVDLKALFGDEEHPTEFSNAYCQRVTYLDKLLACMAPEKLVDAPFEQGIYYLPILFVPSSPKSSNYPKAKMKIVDHNTFRVDLQDFRLSERELAAALTQALANEEVKVCTRLDKPELAAILHDSFRMYTFRLESLISKAGHDVVPLRVDYLEEEEILHIQYNGNIMFYGNGHFAGLQQRRQINSAEYKRCFDEDANSVDQINSLFQAQNNRDVQSKLQDLESHQVVITGSVRPIGAPAVVKVRDTVVGRALKSAKSHPLPGKKACLHIYYEPLAEGTTWLPKMTAQEWCRDWMQMMVYRQQDKLDKLHNQITEARTRIASMLAEAASCKMIIDAVQLRGDSYVFETLNRIRTIPKVVSVEFVGLYIIVCTEPLYIEYNGEQYYIGTFEIKCGHAFSKLLVTNLDAPMRFHPHGGEKEVCWGGYEELLQSAILQSDLYTLVLILLEYLQSLSLDDTMAKRNIVHYFSNHTPSAHGGKLTVSVLDNAFVDVNVGSTINTIEQKRKIETDDDEDYDEDDEDDEDDD